MKLVALDGIWSWIWISKKANLKSFSSENWDYQDSDARNIINKLSLQYSSTMVMFSFEISFEEFKYIMSETYKIDYRAKTIGTALFSIFGLTRIRSMDQSRKIFNRILLCKCKLLIGTFIGVLRSLVTEKKEVDHRNKTKTTDTFVVSDYRDHDGISKSFGFPIESSSTNIKFLNGPLLEKIDFIIVEEKNVWISIQTFIKSTFYDFMTSRTPLQGTKPANTPPILF